MKAADVMSRSVIAVGPDAPLEQAVRLMVASHISGVPIVDAGGRAIGMLTEGDLMRRAEIGTEGEPTGWLASFIAPVRLAGQYVHTHGRRVAELMTRDVRCIAEDTELAEVVRLMQRHRIKRLPVVREGKVVGIVSRADLVRAVSEALGAPVATADDAVIRAKILEGLARKPWVPIKPIGIAVVDGNVALDGYVFDVRQLDAIGVVAENVPGVKHVENRIVCIAPVSEF